MVSSVQFKVQAFCDFFGDRGRPTILGEAESLAASWTPGGRRTTTPHLVWLMHLGFRQNGLVESSTFESRLTFFKRKVPTKVSFFRSSVSFLQSNISLI